MIGIAMLKNFISDESGATAIEYAMLVGLLSIVIITALRMLGPVMTKFVESISTNLVSSTNAI
jgi:pilus assembly protein Flp/PilA